MIDVKFLTWNYVRGILSDHKKLLKAVDVKLIEVPPRCSNQTQAVQRIRYYGDRMEKTNFHELLPRYGFQEESAKRVFLESLR